MLMRIYFDLEIYLKKKILLFVLRYQMLDTRIHRFKIKCLSIQKAFILMGNSAYKTLLFYVISMSKCRENKHKIQGEKLSLDVVNQPNS